jgi:hypothetical protein
MRYRIRSSSSNGSRWTSAQLGHLSAVDEADDRRYPRPRRVGRRRLLVDHPKRRLVEGVMVSAPTRGASSSR